MEIPTKHFWSGRRVLVTGHTGFKGCWLALWLRSLGCEVAGFALSPPTEPSLFRLTGIEADMLSVEGDVRDPAAVDAVLERSRPEVVLHLAAQSLVRPSYDDPAETFGTNVMGTVHLLEAVRRCPSVRAVVVVTSDKCYENREWLWPYREGEPLGGRDPYSASKAATEIVVRSYRDSFFAAGKGRVRLATARAGNVIGGGDWGKDRLIPDLMQALLAGQPLDIRFPEATRPWKHVLDPVRGYLILAERLLGDDGDTFADAWNFGPEDPLEAMPVREIVERIRGLWDSELTVRLAPGPHVHEHTYLRLDPSKARAHLDWAPLLPVATALEWIVEWYRAYRRGDEVRAFTEAQIRRFEALG